jgi:hypothetical protein
MREANTTRRQEMNEKTDHGVNNVSETLLGDKLTDGFNIIDDTASGFRMYNGNVRQLDIRIVEGFL